MNHINGITNLLNSTVGAAKLGQKLCKKDGTGVAYPLTELPDARKWGADKWNPNYRNDAKINCYDSGTAPCKTIYR